MSAHWARLVATLADAGITTVADAHNYPGGTSYSITIRQDARLIGIHDKWWRKNDAVWIGWQVHIEGRRDGIVQREYPLTKNRAEVALQVKAALAREITD